MTTDGPETAAQTPSGDPVIVARAGRYYRNARYLMVLVCLGMSAWFAYDGWVKYPRQNAAQRAQGAEKVDHSDFDIMLQRILAGALPFLAAGVLVRTLHRSRGEYRLDGTTLFVPGHPPVPLENIRQIDKTKWDRKGIATITYEVPRLAPARASSTLDYASPDGGMERTLVLDDFVYDQAPTDAILERIEAMVAPSQAGEETALDEGDDQEKPGA
jgi:hypothetical protein